MIDVGGSEEMGWSVLLLFFFFFFFFLLSSFFFPFFIEDFMVNGYVMILTLDMYYIESA